MLGVRRSQLDLEAAHLFPPSVIVRAIPPPEFVGGVDLATCPHLRTIMGGGEADDGVALAPELLAPVVKAEHRDPLAPRVDQNRSVNPW